MNCVEQFSTLHEDVIISIQSIHWNVANMLYYLNTTIKVPLASAFLNV